MATNQQSTAGGMSMRSGVCPEVDLAQRQNSKASRRALGVCSGLLSFTWEKQSSGVHSGPSQDILTEVVWSLPSGGCAHGGLSTCNAFPEGTIFTKEVTGHPLMARK